MPPGSAKSTYASILFPPWLLASCSWNILAASHTTDLAEKWGRRVRNLIAEESLVLGKSLAQDSQAAGRWSLSDGAEYYAAGVNTGIAGFRARLGMIDDPIRSRQDADSELIRDRVWDWYINDFRPRLVPHAAQILIQTRWHEDDLAGRALNHEEWRVVCIPAIAMAGDPLGRAVGEPLWNDDDYGYGQQIRELSTSTPPRTWSALYQQRPQPDEGTFFKREWFNARYDIKPKLNVYGASDYAVTDEGGDFTEHGVFGVDAEGKLYILDWWSGQASPDIWIDRQLDLIKKWKPFAWFGESGTIRRAIEPFLMRRAMERKIYTRFEWLASINDKPTRARGFQARAAMGNVVLSREPFSDALLDQLLRFPAGTVDDKVDVCSLIGRALDDAHPAIVQKVPDTDIRGIESMTMDQAFKMARPGQYRQSGRI